MYTVIFRAQIKQRDAAYTQTAERLRQLALTQYHCTAFYASTEGDQEIAISYWPTREAIQAWKADPEHQQAQLQGQSRWYHAYSVEILHLEKAYHFNSD